MSPATSSTLTCSFRSTCGMSGTPCERTSCTIGARFLPHRDIPMDHVLQVVRMEGLLHSASVAGVIGFDIVGHRGTHGGRLVAGRVIGLRVGGNIEGQKQAQGEARYKAFHGRSSPWS